MPTEQAGTSPSRLRKRLMRLGLVLTSLLVTTVLADRLLGLLVHPSPPRHQPNRRVRWQSIEYDVESETNSAGMRSPEIARRGSQGERRVVIAGDSFTEGLGVDQDKIFCARLPSLLTNEKTPTNVLNCGLSGVGPAEYGRFMLCVGSEYSPDLMVLVLYANDLTDTAPGADLRLKRSKGGKYRLHSTSLKWQPGSPLRRFAYRLWPWTYATLQRWRDKSRTKSLNTLPFDEQVQLKADQLGVSSEKLKEWKAALPPHILEACRNKRFNPLMATTGLFDPRQIERQLEVKGKAAEESWQSMRHVLTQIMEFCRQDNVRLGIVFAPSFTQVDGSLLELPKRTGMVLRDQWRTEEAEVEKRLRTLTSEQQVPFLSLTNSFRERCREKPGHYHYRYDTHWNSAGHKLAAEEIAKWIRQEGLLDD